MGKAHGEQKREGQRRILESIETIKYFSGGGSSSDGDIETTGQRRGLFGWLRGRRRSDNENEKSSSPNI